MLDDNHPVARLIPKDKRSDELEAALTGLGATDMGTLADALVAGYNAKSQGEALQTRVTELETSVGGMVKIPGEDSSPEDRAAYNKQIGVPETIVDYGLSEMAGNDYGREVLSAFHKANIPTKKAQAVAQSLKEIETKAIAKLESDNAARMTQVTQTLGEKGMDLAKKGAEMLYPDEAMAGIRERLLKDPDVIPGLAKAGSVTIENGKVFNSVTGGGGGSLYPGMDKRGLK